MLVSIIIPLFNKGIKLKRTLDSVINQPFKHVEILVVNDGSIDGYNYQSLISDYKDDRIKYFDKSNGGVSSARNYGIKKCVGDWIYFLDADDEMLPEAFVEFLALLKKYPECRLLTGHTLWLTHGKEKSTIKRHRSHPFYTKNPFWVIWLNICCPSTRNLLIHRSLVEKYGGYDERMSFFEDWEFALRIIRCGCLACTDRYVAVYNQEEGGLSTSSHPLNQEMAYYIPEIIKKASFFERALLYENLEFEKFCWQGNESNVKFYEDMQKKYFSRIHSVLHWVRQRFIL